jgi:hypothetical protein
MLQQYPKKLTKSIVRIRVNPKVQLVSEVLRIKEPRLYYCNLVLLVSKTFDSLAWECL